VGNEVLHTFMDERNTVHSIKGSKAIWSGHIMRTNCLQNTLFKVGYKRREDEEKDISSYWMTLRGTRGY